MINLSPLSKNSVTYFHEWLNDEIAIHFSLSIFQKISSKSEIQKWFDGLILDDSNFTTGIYLSESKELIGYAGICNISNSNKSGEYFIFIGDRNQWGKGLGTLTTLEVLKHGFHKLNLNRIMLTVSEPNKAGIRTYEKTGFKHEGKLRKACLRNGVFHDKLVMSILKEEFKLNNIPNTP